MELWKIRRTSEKLIWVKNSKKKHLPENVFSSGRSLADTIRKEVSRIRVTHTPRIIVFSAAEHKKITELAGILLSSRSSTPETHLLRLITYDGAGSITPFFPTWVREDEPQNPIEENVTLRLAIQIGNWN